MNIKFSFNIVLVTILVLHLFNCSSSGKQAIDADSEKIANNQDSIRDPKMETEKASKNVFIIKKTTAEFDYLRYSHRCYDYRYDDDDNPEIDSFVVEPGNPTYASVNGVLFTVDTTVLLISPKSIKKFKVPASTKKIGHYAFSHTYIEEVKLPEGLEIIENNAFSSCYLLEPVKLPSTVKELGANAFGCYHSWADGTICDGSGEVEIPKNSKLEKVGENALYFNKHLYVPKHLTQDISPSINNPYVEVDPENAAYSSENGILFSKDKETIYSIPNQHYDKLVIPTSVKFFAKESFFNFSADKLVLNDHIENLGCNISNEVGEFVIQKDDICGADHQSDYCLVDGVLFSADTTTLIAYPVLSKRSKYVVPKNVKIIGESAFRKAKLATLVLPDGLETILDGAFAYCENLERIDIPASVSTIKGRFCFVGDSLKKIHYHGDSGNLSVGELLTENIELIGFEGATIEEEDE